MAFPIVPFPASRYTKQPTAEGEGVGELEGVGAPVPVAVGEALCEAGAEGVSLKVAPAPVGLGLGDGENEGVAEVLYEAYAPQEYTRMRWLALSATYARPRAASTATPRGVLNVEVSGVAPLALPGAPLPASVTTRAVGTSTARRRWLSEKSTKGPAV